MLIVTSRYEQPFAVSRAVPLDRIALSGSSQMAGVAGLRQPSEVVIYPTVAYDNNLRVDSTTGRRTIAGAPARGSVFGLS